MRAVNARVLIPLALIVFVAIFFVTSRPAPIPQPTPETPTSASSPVSTPVAMSVHVTARTLEGVVELPESLAQPRVAALVGSEEIAGAAINSDDTYKLLLPANFSASLTRLERVPLPNGAGHLRGDAVGAKVRIVAFNDLNQNGTLDANEATTDLAPFRARQEAAMRGFFHYNLLVISKAASLKETQDHPSGAKGYYRYDLELSPGWHVIEGEFASQGYDIRESPGNQFDLIVPSQAGAKPSTIER